MESDEEFSSTESSSSENTDSGTDAETENEDEASSTVGPLTTTDNADSETDSEMENNVEVSSAAPPSSPMNAPAKNDTEMDMGRDEPLQKYHYAKKQGLYSSWPRPHTVSQVAKVVAALKSNGFL